MSRARGHLLRLWTNASYVIESCPRGYCLTSASGSRFPGFQYSRPYYGDTLHAFGRVFLFRKRRAGHLWALWSREPNLHSLYKPDSTLCRFVSLLVTNSSCPISVAFISDVLAHRQLAAAINYASLHATLHSKAHVEQVLSVVNRRHRMAQMASRASVEFYVGLALKSRSTDKDGKAKEVQEEAFVIRTFRNGLGVFVSK